MLLGLFDINFALRIGHGVGADSFVALCQFVCLFRFLCFFAFVLFFFQVSWPCVVAASFPLCLFFLFACLNGLFRCIVSFFS